MSETRDVCVHEDVLYGQVHMSQLREPQPLTARHERWRGVLQCIKPTWDSIDEL
jgi:hypothetical protein